MMTSIDIGDIDIIIVGAGNAAACSALSAEENGAKVVMLETAPEAERGGNSAFTGGALRFAYDGIEDIKKLCSDLTAEEVTNVDFGTYTVEQYFDDVGRLTKYRCDPDLTEILITGSLEAAVWMRDNGVKFHPDLGRQAYKVDGKFKFWGGLACHISGGGRQLMDTLHKTAADRGIKVLYEATALSLVSGGRCVEGVLQ